MSDYKEIWISPKELENRAIYQTHIDLKRSCEVLLSGTIFNEEGIPLHGAVIEVIAIYYPNHRVKQGYVITNQEGKFAISVIKNDGINYQFNVYEPLGNNE